ncbi:uncharacterized protein LOC106168027 [Lingula anatina]|uniref:Uncharacterized protein LOC106168027 n=1 Tax=Lingula anatina TaxID=7574 RepID=A0A1S3IW39_LINAN|nr:uncharacterized protein LOC106168027 [Lingula anatina]|eukprot:XP_013402405.1 uncharacterized protein LOC106168027 [Lingula anatina]
MSQEQFHSLIENIRGLTEQRQVEAERQGLRWAEERERHSLQDLSDLFHPCDGTVPSETREWIDQMERAIARGQGNITNCATRLALKTSRGALAAEVDYCLRRQNDYYGTAWVTLRDHIRRSFLSPDEAACLRTEIEQIRQTPYENCAAYSRRFRNIARKAYPEPRSVDAERQLIISYARGLSDRRLTRRLVADARPATLNEALTFVDNAEVGAQLFENVVGLEPRHEEPMEVALNSTDNPMERLESKIKKLTKEVSNLKLEKMSASQRRPQQPRQWETVRRENKSKGWADDGTPLCFHCGKAGHKKRECYQLKGQQKREKDTKN